MNVHERIWKALSHEEADRVPTFCQAIEDPFIIRYDDEYEIQDDYGMIKPDLALGKELGLDSKWMPTGVYTSDENNQPELPQEVSEKLEQKNLYVDKNGHINARNNTGETWYQGGVLTTPELIQEWISYIKTFEPAPESHWRYYYNIWEQGIAHDFLPIPNAGGPTYTTWAAIGLKRLAYVLRKYPRHFRDLLRAFTDITIEMHNCLFEQGFDLVFICDDHAFKDRCMFSPQQFETFLMPNFKRLADNAHKHGGKFLLHTDGNMHMEMPYLVQAEVDAIDPLEYEANNDLAELKQKHGDKISLIGNIGASDILSYGSVEDTVKATKHALLHAAEGGGYILAPGSDVLGTVKLENLQAMIETTKKFGTYPLDKERLRN